MSDRDMPFDSELDAEGLPDLEGPLPEKTATGDPQEGMVPPRDYPIAAEEYGITPEEQRIPESLADRVAREEPDLVPTWDEPEELAGQLVEPSGEDVTAFDDEKDLIATELASERALSPEEQAMHITDQP